MPASIFEFLSEPDRPQLDGLTKRELEIPTLLASGNTNEQIAGALSISRRTAERHISNVYLKIDAHNRAEATAYAFRKQIAPPAWGHLRISRQSRTPLQRSALVGPPGMELENTYFDGRALCGRSLKIRGRDFTPRCARRRGPRRNGHIPGRRRLAKCVQRQNYEH